MQGEIERRFFETHAASQESAFWWSGEAAKAYQLEAKKMHDDCQKLLNIYSELERELKLMADAIDDMEKLAEALEASSDD